MCVCVGVWVCVWVDGCVGVCVDGCVCVCVCVGVGVFTLICSHLLQLKLHGTLPLLKQLLDKFSHTSDEAMEVDQETKSCRL